MKILVTGGAGFLGSALCERLLDEGNKVICLDNLKTGRLQNIEKYQNNSKFEFIKHDVINPIDLKIDQIYNAACPASPKAYQKDPINTMKTNVIGILNLCDLAKRNNASLLQFSTSEVYGDALQSPQNEDYWGNVNPCGVRSCYDEGKRAAESICFDYFRLRKTRVRVVRIFNTYGPSMNPSDGRVVCSFLDQALRNKDLTVFGNGSQTRSFCYVDDLIEGLYRSMNLPGDFYGPINLGNPEEHTINELAKLIIKKTESKSSITYQNLPIDDPKSRKPDIKLAKKLLGWKPKITLSKGLDKMIESYKCNVFGSQSI